MYFVINSTISLFIACAKYYLYAFQRLAAHVVTHASVQREAVLQDARLTAVHQNVEVSRFSNCFISFYEPLNKILEQQQCIYFCDQATI